MAANIVRIQNHKNGSVSETVVFQPDVNILYTESESDTQNLVIGIAQYPVLNLTFPSRDLLITFVTDLATAVGSGGSGEVILSNAGPSVMISTTTTTAGPTTTTTTHLTTTTTTVAGPTTTTTTIITTNPPTTTTSTSTTLAPYTYNYSAGSFVLSSNACGNDTLSNVGYSNVDITDLDGAYLYTDNTLTTKAVGDGNYITIEKAAVRHSVQLAADGRMSNNVTC